MNTSNQASLDHEAINALKEATEEMFGEIIEAYLDDTPKRLSLLQEAINNSDLDQLIEQSHGIKGSSGNIGINRLSAICAEIEKLSRSNQLENIPEHIKLAISEFDIVESELKQQLST